jgi:hypothetical protein
LKRILLTFIVFSFVSTCVFAQLELKLPSEITGERSASLFDKHLDSKLDLQVPADATAPMGFDRGIWLVGLAADLSIPLGDFSNGWSTGFSGHAMLGYMMAKNILVNLMIGYVKFSTKEDTQGADVSFSWVPLLIGVHYVFNPGQKLMPFVGAALGLYFLSSSVTISGYSFSDTSTEFGIAPRLGAYYIASATVMLSIMAEYNMIFTSGSTTSALGIQIGGQVALK